MRPRVVHTISGLRWVAGGVSRSVPGLCMALARRGVPTALVTQKPAGIESSELSIPVHEGLDVRLLPGYDFSRLRASYTPGVARTLESLCPDPAECVVHDHGLWLHMNHAVARAASRLGVARVVSPRGMLQEWSLRYRGWRKRIAWLVYQRRDLGDAAAFSATSEAEARAIREAGFEQPVAVIPNGIELPPVRSPQAETRGDRIVLFMSRLHPKKGLLDLIEAWGSVRPAGWRLVIAGPDEGGYGRVVEKAIRRSPCAAAIACVGPLEGEAKRAMLSSAQVFVLPSYSENFGIVVGEALAHGIPVVTTKATPWEPLQRERCGWWIETGPAALGAALSEATALDPQALRAMGERGRALVETELSWDAAAARHAQLYEWLLGGTQAPSFVI